MTGEQSFGEIHFGAAQLGNQARTRRLSKLATQLAEHPGGTLPHKLRDPAALEATYRLMSRDEVTHASVLAPHRAETLRRIASHAGPLLIICDGTELDYTQITSLQRLGTDRQRRQWPSRLHLPELSGGRSRTRGKRWAGESNPACSCRRSPRARRRSKADDRALAGESAVAGRHAATCLAIRG